MTQIELTQIEVDMLREILKKALSELSMEIAFTHRKDFHGFLKRRKEFMEGFIQRLEGKLPSGRRKVGGIDRLRNVDILQGLTDGELQGIAEYFEEEEVGAGAPLCEEGKNAERLYVLEKGSVSITTKKGGRYDISTPGKTVGWSFLVPPFVYTASAVATAPSRVLVIKSPDFYYIIHEEPKMAMKVINNLTQVIASRL